MILQLLTRLRQLCIDPSLVFENYKGESTKIDSFNMKNPITIIIGDNERDNNLISYKRLGSEETISLPINKFIEEIIEEIKKR